MLGNNFLTTDRVLLQKKGEQVPSRFVHCVESIDCASMVTDEAVDASFLFDPDVSTDGNGC